MPPRTLERLKPVEAGRVRDGNGAPPDAVRGWRRDGDGEEARRTTVRIGLWIFLAAVSMLFIAFTAAYLSRRTAPDWQGTVAPPPVLWANTAVLIGASLALERARRAARADQGNQARRGLMTGGALGALFLAGQVLAWRQLAGAGVFLSSHPHSAFFYLLTAVHGIHLLGGLGGIAYALAGARGDRVPAVDGVGVYWHFLDGLWIYLFLILFFL